MWSYIWPILLIVASNTFYQICAKSTPAAVNPYISLTVTYLVGALITAILFFVTRQDSLNTELSKMNWTAFVLGISIVGLEAGNIFMYRAGWKLGIGTLTSTILLAFVMLAVGYLFYSQKITAKQLIGVVVCCAGLYLLN